MLLKGLVFHNSYASTLYYGCCRLAGNTTTGVVGAHRFLCNSRIAPVHNTHPLFVGTTACTIQGHNSKFPHGYDHGSKSTSQPISLFLVKCGS
jgi:hypothetical protein